jgi:hypothetical protein
MHPMTWHLLDPNDRCRNIVAKSLAISTEIKPGFNS